MAEDLDEKTKFEVPNTPLAVTVSLHIARPQFVRIGIGGPGRKEHKDPRFTNAINTLFDELKDYIGASGFFPPQGRFAVDNYAPDDLPLLARYPGDPPPSHVVSLIDLMIRQPMAKSARTKKNKKNAAKLYRALCERLPNFIVAMVKALEEEKFSSGGRQGGTPHSRDIKMDKERKDAYDLLGIPPDASMEKIKHAYRDKARQAHPDANRGVDDGSFHKLQEAYELLRRWHNKKKKK